MYYLIGGGKIQWNETFRHNGPYFPPLYQKHNIPVLINGQQVVLSELAEEYITLYANYLNTDYIKKPKFNKNFLNDFNKVLPDNLKMNSMDEIQLDDIKNHIDKLKEKKKNMSKEEKNKVKEYNSEIEKPFKFCIIDGAQQKVGNYKIEPPGIFLGRGEHPKLGKIKKRILPEDVTLNLDKNAPIPIPNVGGNWKKVIELKDGIWLASWTDNISKKSKYVFTSMESIFKSKSDEEKFDLARKLKTKIKYIRGTYLNDLNSSVLVNRQLATALYLIDNLALRVGGKKNTKEKADTVGVTSLRVEHISFLENNVIKLDFLGKDSIKFCKKVQVSPDVFRNLKEFVNEKIKKNQLFDKISASNLNDYLNNFMKGLTAKVWRTYNASNLFQKELNKLNPEKLENLDESEKIKFLITFFNQANTAVALLCNHQKNVSTNFSKQIENIDEKIKKLKKTKKKSKKEKLQKIKNKIELLKIQKEAKSKMKNVSLGTSKNNYIDPRIIFAFIKKYDIPEDKLFTKTLLSRFEWAKKEKDFKF
uniref:DNA topoisomerase 1 n=1 Tax=Megaviridae environmental sample TaxID=1737588 RepID=A0A5J6VJK4_9VIRU|nr:MAG: DNA topoisomerase I-like protein [Megaviridae environmental sample]